MVTLFSFIIAVSIYFSNFAAEAIGDGPVPGTTNPALGQCVCSGGCGCVCVMVALLVLVLVLVLVQ
jgi:hypothetical protein